MNQENKQLPTAEETLISVIMPNFRQVFGDNDTEWIVKAMQEHTRLHTAPLREELEKLREWKDSAMKAMSDIAPGINELKAENQMLREALEWYANSGNYLSLENVISKRHTFEVERRAKEALKGGQDA
ncbi:MAG: hypothetical protein QHC79_09375 [Pseudosphingobacterium sp.]|nr:hypothetical protein [Pseudosphingobacterium sp.]